MRINENLQQIVEGKILAGFDATPYPGDDALVTNQSGCDPESEEVFSDFRGKSWKEVPIEILRKHKEALPLLTPRAFRYYLPAYMIGCVDSFYDVDVVLDSVLFNLTPPEPRRGWEWNFFRERAEQFNEQERDAITSFLELMDRYQRADWANEENESLRDRVKPALDFWRELTSGP